MKRIVLIGVIGLVALGIYAVFTSPRRAPPGVYFTLIHLPVRSGSTLTGVEPGTRVVCVKDEGPVVLVKVDNLEFEAKRQYLTNDLKKFAAFVNAHAPTRSNKRKIACTPAFCPRHGS